MNDKILTDIARVEKARGTPDEAYFNKNYGGIDAYIANQQARMAQPAREVAANPPQGFDHAAELANMEKYLQGASDSYFKQQQATLESNLTAQISELQAAYQQAVADGQISVRDAEAQFEEQVKQIQQQAYLDAERTALYGQEMGIQNSQQMVGLMQGDMARKQSLMQEGMSERDKRINDIKDRMNAIKSQKDISIARAQADYRSALLGAEGEAQRMYNEGMFGLMRDDYGARRDQSFTQENLRLQDELTRGQMGLQHQHALAQATHESVLAIDRMNIQQGFDLEKMAINLEHDIKKMGVQFGYESALQGQAHSNALARISAEYKTKVKAEEDVYQKQLERDLRGVTPGTEEYKVITANNERALKNKLIELHAGTVYEAVTSKVIAEYPGDDIKPPKNYTEPYGNIVIGEESYPQYDLLGGLKNWLTGYDKKDKEYQKKLEAQSRYHKMLEPSYGYFPWN